nr:chitooligosaccharide deacetylase-like [Nerophis lumbriciformis]
MTFDDGPDPDVTPAVLELLEEHGARASFFLIGERAERYPELVAEIVRRGHQVENHTQHHHYHFAFLGLRRLGTEIDRSQDVLGRLAGRSPKYFRAPAGIRSPLLEPQLARRGLRLASWTRRAFDTVERNPQKVVRRLLRGLRDGDVLLLHDGSAARDSEGRAVVLGALPTVLEELAARGLRAVPLPDR